MIIHKLGLTKFSSNCILLKSKEFWKVLLSMERSTDYLCDFKLEILDIFELATGQKNILFQKNKLILLELNFVEFFFDSVIKGFYQIQIEKLYRILLSILKNDKYDDLLIFENFEKYFKVLIKMRNIFEISSKNLNENLLNDSDFSPYSDSNGIKM